MGVPFPVPDPVLRRVSSVPEFTFSTHGRTYFDSAHNKREYEKKTPTAFNRKDVPEFKKVTVPPFMLEKASDKIVLTLHYKDVNVSESRVSSSEGCAYVTSYSMKATKQGETPTIYAPGNPPLYKKPRNEHFPLKIPHDTGSHFQDEHAARFPKHQYLPMFQSLGLTNPTFRFDKEEVKTVVNRSTLEKLIRFIKDVSDQAFHLELSMEGDTLFIGRKVRNSKCTSMPNTCGHNFEAYLTIEDPELEHATGHHCFIKYRLGDLMIIVRSEIDAFMDESDVPEDVDRPPCHYPETFPIVDSTTDNLQHEDCAVIPKGKLVKQHQFVEMKSNVKSRPLEQMWDGRTVNCALGSSKRSEDGHKVYPWREFKTEHITQTGEKGFEWWENNQRSQKESDKKDYLEKLVWLLHKLRETVENTKDRSAILVSLPEAKDNVITIYEAKERIQVGPKEIVQRYFTKEE